MAVLTKITQRSLADNAVTSAHVQLDGLAATDIADDAIGTAELASDLSISTSGNIATTGSGTLAIAGTSALTGNVTAGGTLGVTGATTLTGAATASAGLSVVGAAALTSVKYTDAQNLSGTYTTHELIMGKTFTLNGNLTVNENLILGSMSGAGTNITIQPDSTHRTISSTGGTGILEGGEILGNRPQRTSLTGMTGELGSDITGSPNLNLTTGLANSSTSFPAGHMINHYNAEYNGGTTSLGGSNTSPAELSTSLRFSYTPIAENSKLLVSYQTTKAHVNTRSGMYAIAYEVTGSSGTPDASTLVNNTITVGGDRGPSHPNAYFFHGYGRSGGDSYGYHALYFQVDHSPQYKLGQKVWYSIISWSTGWYYLTNDGDILFKVMEIKG